MAAFESRLDNLGKDSIAANNAVNDLDSFKAAFTKVAKDCGDCHHTYRMRTE
jgi:cytochrome c556